MRAILKSVLFRKLVIKVSIELLREVSKRTDTDIDDTFCDAAEKAFKVYG